MNDPSALDLATTIPTMLPDLLRAVARFALKRSVDPLNKLDENPYIGIEWLDVSEEFSLMAARLEQRLLASFRQ